VFSIPWSEYDHFPIWSLVNFAHIAAWCAAARANAQGAGAPHIEHGAIIADVEVAAAMLAFEKMQRLGHRAAPALPDHGAARD